VRFDLPEIGMITVRTKGSPGLVRDCDEALAKSATGLAREIRLLQRRVLKRFDNTARSFYAVADAKDSCFEGSLLELALGADRFYMLIDGDDKIAVRTSVANAGFMTMSSGLTRLEARFYGDASAVQKVLRRGSEGDLPSEDAEQLGIATIAADDIDFEDELRIAIEERASLSPDALTGMEASLRFVGPETLETKIFGRLSAWQNWIFTRANSTGEHGALTLYGQPERPQFQWKRT
jgi:benzoyl-CoA-dihydrodiol lyase